jgi:translation initiation factor 1
MQGERMAKKKKLDTSEGQGLTSNPFAQLAGLGETLPSGTARLEPKVESSSGAGGPKTASRAVVRYQRKGRGGKEVTLIEKLDLAEEVLLSWCSELKKSLGCGGHVEGSDIVLAGDQRERLPELLRARGARQVTVS